MRACNDAARLLLRSQQTRKVVLDEVDAARHRQMKVVPRERVDRSSSFPGMEDEGRFYLSFIPVMNKHKTNIRIAQEL